MLNSPIEEIKSRLDIVEVTSSYIKLSKAGANYRALCPFHSEKKPSFFVSPARQIWHCFGCGAGSNIFDFVMKMEGVEFGDALRILAQRAGIELKRQDPKLRTERQRLYEICELATRFFEKQLKGSKIGQEAKKYLLGRGITEESIKKWCLGYAPDTWQGLSDFLVSQGFKREEVEKAGLAIKNEQGGYYDRFRGRIIFPISDFYSQVIGFGGRIFQREEKSGEEAKYINTPNTLLYDKSRILYGLDKARMTIRKKNSCILVEGYTDVILANQAGFENIVATSGTALTPYQLKILKRYSENLLTAFDMDIAGDSATKRGIDLAQLQGFNIKIITLPENLDPADVISKDPKEFEKLVDNNISILDFYFQGAFACVGTVGKVNKKTPEGKKEISNILLPVIKRIPNKIEQSFWIQKLAKELEVGEGDIIEELKKVKLEEKTFGLEPEEIINLPQKTRKELLEERLASLVLKSTGTFLDSISKEDLLLFSPQISQLLANFKNKSLPLNFADCPPELIDLLNYLSLRSEIEEISDKDSEKEFKICLREIKTLEIKNKLDKISKDIKKAEGEKKSSELQKLLEEFDSLSKLLQDLDGKI